MANERQHRIRLGFWVVAALPILICVLGFLSVRNLFESAGILARSNSIIQHLDRVAMALSDIEIAEREYVLTGSDSTLARYRAARNRIKDDAQELFGRLRSDTDQRMWMRNLQAVIDEMLANVEQTVAERQASGPEGAAAIIVKRDPAAAFAASRTAIERIRATEQRQLDERSAKQRSSLRNTLLVFASFLVLNAVLVGMLWWMIRREAAESRREEERIRELNADLERRVEERTHALQRSNEDLQQFAYIVSHDLQEPLRMVASYTELLRRRYHGKLDEEADEYIQFAVDGTKRMSTLIKDLLQYSRAGETQDGIDVIDAGEVLETVRLNLRARIEETGASVTNDPLPRVVTERVWFTQLLQNLVGNGLKYRAPDRLPLVHVSAAEQNGETVFAIRDNGIGIEARYKDQVFGVFKRLHGREYEGTGIGLAVCKKIVERNGGRIWFESSPGTGSTFFFTMPTPGRAARSAGTS